MPVSSRTSRNAVCSGFSPRSTKPLGKANNTLWGFDVAARTASFCRSSFRGSITAVHQAFSKRRITIPPAEISRTMAHKLTGLWNLVIPRTYLTRRAETIGQRGVTAGNRPFVMLHSTNVVCITCGKSGILLVDGGLGFRATGMWGSGEESGYDHTVGSSLWA